MWLEATRKYTLIPYEPSDCVVRWSVDVKAPTGDDVVSKPFEFTVGRFLADELRMWEAEEWDFGVWDVADCDSSGLEAALASVLDEHGRLRQFEFEASGNSIVYLYRYELHPDFRTWRMATMDAFCRTFDSDALILAQYHTTWLSDTEFGQLGFRKLPPTRFKAPIGYQPNDRQTEFMLRDNATQPDYSVKNYPGESPDACKTHSDWVESKGPWADLV